MIEAKSIWQDVDKRNAGTRLVRVDAVVGDFAHCTILSAGGRPAEQTKSPELRGTGFVGQPTRIRISRLLKPYLYRRVALFGTSVWFGGALVGTVPS